jgi:DNA helicase-2/ATP-dependent DNA helicase PcrA
MRNILNFQKDYPEALIVKLEQNYRSTKKIIRSANTIIKNNTESLDKELWTENDTGESIIYGECYDDGAEANWIAENIKEYDGDLKDNLILYRTNSQSRKIEESLLKYNLPYRVLGGMKFYDRKEIKDILSYLKILHNPNDIVSFKRIINTPSRKIGAKSIQILDMYREQFGINYLQIIENIEEAEELRNAAKIALGEFGKIYNSLMTMSSQIEVSALISEIVKIIGYKEYLQGEFSKEEVESKKDNLVELENVASEYNGMGPRESLSMFLEEVALITDMDTKDERQDYVTLMTIHTSK